MDEAQIGGYPIARLQKHQIAGHQLFGWHCQALAAADRYGLWREHVPDGIQRPLGLAFLDKAEHRVDHDDAQDHSRVNPVRQRGRDCRGAKQNVNQHVVELGEQSPERPRPPHLGRFGPKRSRRCCASASVRPMGLHASARNTWLMAMVCHGAGADRPSGDRPQLDPAFAADWMAPFAHVMAGWDRSKCEIWNFPKLI